MKSKRHFATSSWQKPLTEGQGDRLKRLSMRAMRRGTKEMDIILGRYAKARLEYMPKAQLDLFEALLEENDHDLYQWVTGQTTPTPGFTLLIAEISSFARGEK